MMTSKEKNRFVAGSLLIVASVAIGAASGEWTPEADVDAPLLVPVDAVPPLPALDDADADPAADDASAPTTRPADAPARPVDKQAAVIPAMDNATRATVREEALLVLEGGASWYSDALAGRPTASGEPYDPAELIAAHRALPFGTRLRVTNLANDRSVEVRVIDRGPFIAGRIVDLSRRAAAEIGIVRAGHGRVRVEVLEYGEG